MGNQWGLKQPDISWPSIWSHRIASARCPCCARGKNWLLKVDSCQLRFQISCEMIWPSSHQTWQLKINVCTISKWKSIQKWSQILAARKNQTQLSTVPYYRTPRRLRIWRIITLWRFPTFPTSWGYPSHVLSIRFWDPAIGDWPIFRTFPMKIHLFWWVLWGWSDTKKWASSISPSVAIVRTGLCIMWYFTRNW